MLPKTLHKKNNNAFFRMAIYRYLPYWPLFVILMIACCFGAWQYTKSLTPMYEASASVLIKDDNEVSSASKVIEAMNVISAKPSVENEIEVLHSRSLMKQVVERLHLYANIVEKEMKPAYASSPVLIRLKDPSQMKECFNVPFSYDETKQAVSVNGNSYKMNQWVITPFGELQFVKNIRQKNAVSGPLYFQLTKSETVANMFLGNLFITPVSKTSSVVLLKLKETVPERGEDVLNTLADVYSSASVNDQNATAKSTMAFLDDRIRYVEDDLDSLERKIQRYKAGKGIVDISAQGQMFLENVSVNDKKLSDMNLQLAVLDQVEKYVVSKDSRNGIVPSTLGVGNPVLNDLLQKLYDSEIQYEKLRTSAGENNPILVRIKTEMEKVRPGVLENIHNQRNSAYASIQQLNKSVNGYYSQLRAIPQQEKDLLDFTRQQGVKNSVYTFLLQKREEIGLSLSATAANSRLIDVAQASQIPNKSKVYSIYVLAIVMALVLGIGFINAREIFSTKLLFRSELESNCSVPIVGELASVKTNEQLVVQEPNQLASAEQFRQMCVSLGLYSSFSSKKKILVTSGIAGEGKSFVSANLALTLAQSGKKTVLIDLDMRNPKTTESLALITDKGLVDFLAGSATVNEVVRPTEIKQLYVVPAGKLRVNPIELLLNGRLQLLLEELGKEFDFIVADTSPLEPVSDTYVFAPYFDTTLYVVRHCYTPKSTIQMLDESSKIKDLKNLALVFNGIKSRGFMRKGYGYGYGYGYQNSYHSGLYAKTARQAKYN